MTDLAKLIAADRPVRVVPDRGMAEDLGKLDAFWSGAPMARPEDDLTGVSDAEMRASLASDGIMTEMPRGLRETVAGRHRLVMPLALAACLAGALVAGVIHWPDPAADGTYVTAADPAPLSDLPAAAADPDPGPDPYLLARPDRPAAGALPTVEAPLEGGLQSAAGRTSTGEADLTRAEFHEMQYLLNRLGYGPLRRDGLPSLALDAAMSRFRADRGLDPDPQRHRDGLVMLRLAARAPNVSAPKGASTLLKGE